MMIIKGFLRDKKVKIYILITSILLLAISLLFIALNYLDIANKEAYYKISLFYLESQEDKYKELQESKKFINIHKALKFEYYGTIINNEDISEFELSKMVLVYADKEDEYNLNKNEVIIVFGQNQYDNNKPYFDNYINNQIHFELNDEEISLNIKDIKNDNRSKIIISSTLFNELNKKYSNNIYTANFISEDIADSYYSTYDLDNDDEMLNLDIETNPQYRKKMKDNLKIVQYASYICIIVFVIFNIIVNKNIISDLKGNISLEKRLGYTKTQTKLNIFKRLSVLQLISYIIATIISIFIIILLLLFTKLSLNFHYVIYTGILEIIILLCDLLLILIVNNKSKY